MPESKKYTLLLTKIYCVESSAERDHDDVYLKIFEDGALTRTEFEDLPFKMNAKGDCERFVDIAVDVTSLTSVRIELWDKDVSSDDQLGSVTIVRADPLEGYKTAYQMTGKKKAQYQVSYRIIGNPIPTLRLLGIYCEKSSAGCNAEAMRKAAEIVAQCADVASDVIGMVKTPRAQAMSKAFEAVALCVEAVTELKIWLQGAIEGDDDVYIQHIDPSQGDDKGGGFCPPASAPTRFLKLNDGDQVCFEDRYGEYFRFALDRGPVTIHIREWDPLLAQHVSLGSMTIGDAEYQALADKGATSHLCSEFLDRRGGEGCIYHLCYSLGLEDWSLPATTAALEGLPAPGEIPTIATGSAVRGTWESTTRSPRREGCYAKYYAFDLTEATDVSIQLRSDIATCLYLMRGKGTDGEVVASDVRGSTSSELFQNLAPGSYTVEATTHAPFWASSFELGLLSAVAPIVINDVAHGTWDSAMVSVHRGPKYYARYYSFAVYAPMVPTVTMSASHGFPYFLLLNGTDPTGAVVDSRGLETSNVDVAPGPHNAEMIRVLEPGNYVLEVTSADPGTGGTFDIAVRLPVPERITLGQSLREQVLDTSFRSQHRGINYFVRLFTFSLEYRSKIRIVATGVTDNSHPQLSLIRGSACNGPLLDVKDDAILNESVFRIVTTLDPGDYTIEVTARGGALALCKFDLETRVLE